MTSILSIIKRNFIRIMFAIVFFIHVIQDSGSILSTNYERYVTALQSIILALGLIGVCMIIALKSQVSTSHTLKLWSISFILVMSLLITFVIYINPDGIFPWNQMPTHITGGARVAKFDLYNELKEKPDIILIGSSRAHTLPVNYLQQKFSQPSFNWSVEGGGPLDALTITKFLIDKQNHVPRVLVVELAHYLTAYAWQERTPLMMFPYLPDQASVLESFQAKTLSILSYSTFAKSTYTFIYIWGHDKFSDFLADGTQTSDTPVVPWAYRDALKLEAPTKKIILQCTQLPQAGKAYTDALVQLADQYQIGVVFYISPLNSDFLDRINFRTPAYQNCLKKMNDYMASITESHPNIFYLDLLRYHPVSSLRANGFVDTEHMNKYAGQLLLEALAPKVSSALQWTVKARK